MSEVLDPANADQIAYWNGKAGQRWTERQEIQDAVLAPVTARLFQAANLTEGEKVIDIGCGCGDTTLAAAEAIGERGQALGVDISERMLARARERAAALGGKTRFRLADASAEDFSAEAADVLMSRFGVMFFADPSATFANLRRALKKGGRLAFVCWREPKLNPWLVLPFHAMKHRVPPQPERRPEDPGPFAFADDVRLRGILETAEFTDVAIEARSMPLDMAVGRGLEIAVRTALEIGPVSRALDGQPEDVCAAAEADVRAALTPYLKGDSVELGASVWVATARNG
jgi:SAM-dependent methyltransferase